MARPKGPKPIKEDIPAEKEQETKEVQEDES